MRLEKLHRHLKEPNLGLANDVTLLTERCGNQEILVAAALCYGVDARQALIMSGFTQREIETIDNILNDKSSEEHKIISDAISLLDFNVSNYKGDLRKLRKKAEKLFTSKAKEIAEERIKMIKKLYN